MLYVLHGSNFKKKNPKLSELLESLQKKRPDSEVFHLQAEEITSSKLRELTGGLGLFDQKYIVVFDDPFGEKDREKIFLEFLPEIQKAEHVFLLNADVLDKRTLTKLAKYSTKVQEYGEPEEKKDFNIFTLADALGARDSKKLWLLYRGAIEKGETPETISGTLFWQLKSIILAQKHSSGKSADLKPFVYTKAKRFAGNFPDNQAGDLLVDLNRRYHRSRIDGPKLELALESFILEL